MNKNPVPLTFTAFFVVLLVACTQDKGPDSAAVAEPEAEYDAIALTVETIDDVILHLRTWREEEVSDKVGRYGFRSVGSTTVFFHRNRTG